MDSEVVELWKEFVKKPRFGDDYQAAKERVEREMVKRGFCVR